MLKLILAKTLKYYFLFACYLYISFLILIFLIYYHNNYSFKYNFSCFIPICKNVIVLFIK